MLVLTEIYQDHKLKRSAFARLMNTEQYFNNEDFWPVNKYVDNASCTV